MDLRLYSRVLWRFRAVVLAGFVVAVALAFLAYVRVDLDGGAPSLAYRDHEAWASHATLLVTERGAPTARSVFEETIPPSGTAGPKTYTPEFAPSNRFIELANLYARLATGDEVKRLMLKDGPIKGAIEATQVVTPSTGSALPMISITGSSMTPEAALALTNRATAAFQTYLEREQRVGGIPADQRVLLEEVNRPGRVERLSARSKTVPIVAFLTVMLAAAGLAFVLENLRPRIRPVSAAAAQPGQATRVRRSA